MGLAQIILGIVCEALKSGPLVEPEDSQLTPKKRTPEGAPFAPTKLGLAILTMLCRFQRTEMREATCLSG